MQLFSTFINLIVREVLGSIFRFSGISYILREVLLKNKATIIVYHDPEPKVFEKHIRYLSKHYNFLSLNKLVDAIHKKDRSDIPAKPLIVTIDDGHSGNYKLLEIFKRYNINPTIYLCSHVINTNRKFWFKACLSRSEELKKLPYEAMLKSLWNEVNYQLEKEYQQRQALNIDELNKMLPYVEFGSHTKFHPILTTCTDEKCREEVEESKKYLETLLNRPIEHFAYPNGDYAEREMKFAMNCGYKSARTLDCGLNDIHSNPFKLKVNEIQDNASLNILCAQVGSLFPFIRYLRKNYLKSHRKFISNIYRKLRWLKKLK